MIKFVHNYKVIHLSGYEVRESKGAGPLTACAPNSHTRRVTHKEPDAVYIQ